jgi:hypothetical protein
MAAAAEALVLLALGREANGKSNLTWQTDRVN